MILLHLENKLICIANPLHRKIIDFKKHDAINFKLNTDHFRNQNFALLIDFKLCHVCEPK